MTVPAPRISPVPPGPSLLTAARRLPGGLDWERGIEWSVGHQRSYAQEFCPAEPTKELSTDRGLARTHPFVIYTPIVRDMTSVLMTDQEAIAREATEAHTAAKIAEALWLGTGVVDVEAPTLRRSAIRLHQGTAVDLDDGFGALLQEYESCTDGEGGAVVHMPSALAPFALGGGSGGARVCWPEGSFYRGANGSVVVLGPGYPNGPSTAGASGYGPLTSTGPDAYAANTAAQSWVYITGPVEYDVTPVVALPEDERDRIPFRTNRYEVWGERTAIVRFDPSCVFGVLVNNPVPWTEVS